MEQSEVGNSEANNPLLLNQCSSKKSSQEAKQESTRSTNIDINELLDDPDIPSIVKPHELRFPEKVRTEVVLLSQYNMRPLNLETCLHVSPLAHVVAYAR